MIGPGIGGPGIFIPLLADTDTGFLDGYWYIDHLDHDFNVFQTIRPENLHFTLRESDISTISYEISRNANDIYGDRAWFKNSDGSAFIAPKRTGFRLRYGIDVILEGEHADPGTNYEWGSEVLAVAGKSYTNYLNERHFPFDPRPGHRNDYVLTPGVGGVNYQAGTPTDVRDIVAALFDAIFTQPYSLPLTRNLGPLTGIKIKYRLDLADTTMFFDLLKSLSQQYPGFEFEVTNNRVLKLYSPKYYGTPDNAVALPGYWCIWDFDDRNVDFPNGLETLSFTNTGPEQTHLFGTGAGLAGQLGVALDYVPGMAKFWRRDGVKDYGDITNRAALEGQAQGDLSFGLNPVHEIPISVLPDEIPDFWKIFKPGVAVYIHLDLEWHQIDSPHEVVEIDCTVSTEGEQHVQLGLNQIYSTTGLSQGGGGSGGGGGSIGSGGGGALGSAWRWDASTAPLAADQGPLTVSMAAAGALGYVQMSVAIADAAPGTPFYNIPTGEAINPVSCPIPNGTRPGRTFDEALTVRCNDIDYDFGNATYDSGSGLISYAFGITAQSKDAIYEPGPNSGNAARFPLRQGLITPADVLSGVIDHPLVFSIDNTGSGVGVYPANTIYGGPAAGHIPYGSWIRLDPAFNVAASGLPAFDKMVCIALQQYGAFLRDINTDFSFYATDQINQGGNAADWAAAGLTMTEFISGYPYAIALDGAFPWSSLQLLQPPTP